jgi:hypothetical protein
MSVLPSQPDLSWLDKIIAEQKAVATVLYGNPSAVSNAVKAYDVFSEDELEAHANNVRAKVNAEGVH